jgi:CRP/FNR family transcriptional regulator, cyclic AMP receptor protein
MRASDGLVGDPTLEMALASSHLASLPEETTDGLLASAMLVDVAAGSNIHRDGDERPHFELVVSGLLRVFVTALDGRTMTVRYCRTGSILGAVSLFTPAFAMPASVRAVTEAQIVSMPVPLIREMVGRDPSLARALIEELSDRVMSFAAEIPGSAFTTVRQRVARHLLDLASSPQIGSPLMVTASQQELAESVGSVREVVVRVLRELREEELVETGQGRIVLLDPTRLAAEASPMRHGTKVPDRRDSGR